MVPAESSSSGRTQHPEPTEPPRTVDAARRALEASASTRAVLLWEAARRGRKAIPIKQPAIYPFLPRTSHHRLRGDCRTRWRFTHRAMDQEGVTSARGLRHSIAAFVLRYRIQPLYGRSDYLLDGQQTVQPSKLKAPVSHLAGSRGHDWLFCRLRLDDAGCYQTLSPQADAATSRAAIQQHCLHGAGLWRLAAESGVSI